MWTCQQCNEQIEDQFDSCWRCASGTMTAPLEKKDSPWVLRHRMFRGTFISWDSLFAEAAQFATEIGPEHVQNISHSAAGADGVVVVWYWTLEKR